MVKFEMAVIVKPWLTGHQPCSSELGDVSLLFGGRGDECPAITRCGLSGGGSGAFSLIRLYSAACFCSLKYAWYASLMPSSSEVRARQPSFARRLTSSSLRGVPSGFEVS